MVVAAVLLYGTPALAAVVEVAPGADLQAEMNALVPGDELVLSGGEYTLTGRLGVTMVGTQAAPIIVRAADLLDYTPGGPDTNPALICLLPVGGG